MISKWNLEDFFLADSFYIYFTLMQSCTCCRNMQSLLASRPLTLSFYLHTCITIYVLYFEHYGNSFVDIYVNWVQVLNMFRYPFCVIIEGFFSLKSQSTPETKPLYCEFKGTKISRNLTTPMGYNEPLPKS